MKKNKPKLKEKLGYFFDLVMAKGTIALVAMLFLVTAVVVVIAGVLGVLMNNDMSAGVSIWQSLMHAIDAGNLAGDDPAGSILFFSSAGLLRQPRNCLRQRPFGHRHLFSCGPAQSS